MPGKLSRSRVVAIGILALSACVGWIALDVGGAAIGDAFAQTAKKATKKPATAKQTKPSEPYPLNDDTDDPAVWGKVFPLQYELYLKTVDMQRTKYGGSEAMPHAPTQGDPRSIVSQSKVEEDAGLKAMWQGYAFAADFREDRGHAYMLEDQTYTKRQVVVAQPGACMNCHASTYVAYKKEGDGDITKGFAKINQLPYADAAKLVKHPVSCIDCHDSQTTALRVTRPAFIEGIKAFKASQGINDYDVNKQATRQEMRAYVCGQCHVEYYFKGAERRLVFPWAKGLKVENIMAYYDEAGFRDWTHKDTGAPALKAQHPEFEMWSQGIHARSGVACADCHMPYKREGAVKVSDHWVRSPALNVSRACQSCHPYAETEILARIDAIQTRTHDLLERSARAMVDMLDAIVAAKTAGASDEQLAPALELQRKAQWRLDFVAAENSMGFHAPAEVARILGESIDYSRQAQLAAGRLHK